MVDVWHQKDVGAGWQEQMRAGGRETITKTNLNVINEHSQGMSCYRALTCRLLGMRQTVCQSGSN